MKEKAKAAKKKEFSKKKSCISDDKKAHEQSKKKRVRRTNFYLAFLCLLCVAFAFTVLSYRYMTEERAKSLQNTVIYIDPGHGFDDPGAKNDLIGDSTEAEINMSISKKLGEKLTEMGFEVVYTHDGLTMPDDFNADRDGVFDPIERVCFSDSFDEENAMFISIHCDSFPSDATVEGTRLYFQIGQETMLTKGLLSEIADEIDGVSPSRRETIVKSLSEDEAYTVIKNRGETVSFLIECGFLTNPEDAVRLTDPTWQDEFAGAIAKGIKDFCGAK